MRPTKKMISVVVVVFILLVLIQSVYCQMAVDFSMGQFFFEKKGPLPPLKGNIIIN